MENPIVASVIKAVAKGVASKLEAVKGADGHPLYEEVVGAISEFEKHAAVITSSISADDWAKLQNAALDKINQQFFNGKLTPTVMLSVKAAISALIKSFVNAEHIMAELGGLPEVAAAVPAPAKNVKKAAETPA